MSAIVEETREISFCPTVVVVADIEFVCTPDSGVAIGVEVDIVVVEVDVVVVEVDVVVVRPTPEDSPITFVGEALNRTFRSEKPAPIALP
jgi:hypothetical protein